MNAKLNLTAAACRKAGGFALLIGLAGLAAGCESIEKADRFIERHWVSESHMLPPEKLATTVRRDDTSQAVAFVPRSATLAGYERDQLVRFVANSGAARGDRAVIAISTSSGRGLADRRVAAISRDLHRYGLRVTRSYGPGEPDTATVTISRVVAVAPDCPQWEDLMKRSVVDEYKPRLGCLTASSLATSVHRPADLVQGRPSGPSDGVVVGNGIQALRDGKFDPPITGTGTGSPQSGQSGQQGQTAK